MHGTMNLKSVITVICAPEDGWSYHSEICRAFAEMYYMVQLYVLVMMGGVITRNMKNFYINIINCSYMCSI
jgi:hypothetical protein